MACGMLKKFAWWFGTDTEVANAPAPGDTPTAHDPDSFTPAETAALLCTIHALNYAGGGGGDCDCPDGGPDLDDHPNFDGFDPQGPVQPQGPTEYGNPTGHGADDVILGVPDKWWER